jgi:CspA family cold shock protein
MDNRNTGVVKWFSQMKGFGFIAPDGSEGDIFVHYSAIDGQGHRNLQEGQRVEFNVEQTAKGPTALNVVIVPN